MSTDEGRAEKEGAPPADQVSAKSLRKALVAHQALPFLFIGSGLTRRYLALPDWPGLLRTMADQIDEDFDFHLATANGDLPATASSIAVVFHPRWWKDKKWEAQRAAHHEVVKNEEGALKVAVSEYISQNQNLAPGKPGIDDPDLASEIAALRDAVIDGVITTNYDSLPEQVFPQFPVYVGQDELLLSDAQFIAETYKIHGSASNPNSLVVTTKDYEKFRQRNSYLAAKLLTIFAEHPVLFVGYSMNDDYIGEILDEIATAVGPERFEELGKRIYFIEWNPDSNFASTVEQSTLIRGPGRLPVTRIETHSLMWIWDVLRGLERPFPATLVRELSKHVYDLVLHPDPEQARPEVVAVPIDGNHSGLRVIFGVGRFTDRDLEDLTSTRAIQLEDIEIDLLGMSTRRLDAEDVLAHGIPDVIRPRQGQYVPVYRYLRESGRVNLNGETNYEGLPPVIRKLAEKDLEITAGNRARYVREVQGKLTTPRALIDSELPHYFMADCLVLLDPKGYDLEELRDVLIELYEDSRIRVSYLETSLRRALCHYDRLSHAMELETIAECSGRKESEADH